MRAKSRRERSTTLGQRHVAVRCGPAAMQGSLSTQAMSPLQSQCLLVSFSQILDRFHHHHLALRQHRHHLLVLLLQLPRLHSSRQPPFSTLPSVRELGGWERDAARRRKRLCGRASGGWVRKDGGRDEKKKNRARLKFKCRQLSSRVKPRFPVPASPCCRSFACMPRSTSEPSCFDGAAA